MMKRDNHRSAALLLAVVTLFAIAASGAVARVRAQASGGVFIVENDDELDNPNNHLVRTTVPTTEAPTTAAPMVTTAQSGTGDAIGRVFSALDEGLNKLISGLGGETTTIAPATAATAPTAVYTVPTTAPTPATAAPAMNAGNLTANFTMPVPTTAAPAGTTAPLIPYGVPAAEPTAAAVPQGDGIVRYTIEGATQKTDDSALSGSTLTIIVFVAAVLILILVIILALVIMTRRNEFNSKVMNRSTLPNVEKPDNQIFPEGGVSADLSDIRGWENPGQR